MVDATESSNEGHLSEELLTGIAKLVYKLSETADGINTRMENIEKAMIDLLKEGFSGLEKQLEKSHELLTGLNSPEGMLSDQVFTKGLGEVSKLISETAVSIEKSVTDAFGRSDSSRADVLGEKLQILVDSLSGISKKMEGTRESVENKLSEIQKGTATEVSQIDKSMKESSKLQKDQLEEMKELLTLHSVEIKDNKVRDLNRTAIMHFNNAEYEQAITALDEAIALSPESPELLTNIAHIKASQGKIDEAEKDFRAALVIDPDLEPALSGLGVMLVHTGRATETIDFLKRFFEEGTDPSISVMIAMSRAYAAQGNHSKAVELLEKAEKTAPGHPGVEQELAHYRE